MGLRVRWNQKLLHENIYCFSCLYFLYALQSHTIRCKSGIGYFLRINIILFTACAVNRLPLERILQYLLIAQKGRETLQCLNDKFGMTDGEPHYIVLYDIFICYKNIAAK